MSTDPTPITPNGGSADAPSDVNKRGLWPLWHRNQEWREKLSRKAAHKSLDIPDDDMNITNTKVGLGTLGTMAVAGAAGIPGLAAAAILGYALLKDKGETPKSAEPTVVSDSEYEVLFFDANGKSIPVAHISTKPK